MPMLMTRGIGEDDDADADSDDDEYDDDYRCYAAELST